MANSMVHYLIQVYIKIEQTLVTKYILIVVELGMKFSIIHSFYNTQTKISLQQS